MSNKLTQIEQFVLLKIARQAIEKVALRAPIPDLIFEDFTPRLKEPGVSFVTLTIDGNLRGCIGALEPHSPLAKDVQEHAIAAAVQDFRFPRVEPSELPFIHIEISILTPSKPLIYETPEELLLNIRPHIDGVILQDGVKKSTFLPQVWKNLHHPEEFLSHLCMKMGAPRDLWRNKPLKVYTYQVQEFGE